MERNRKGRLLILLALSGRHLTCLLVLSHLSCLPMLISITYAGLDIHGILLFRTLIGKIFGSIDSVGGGLALGKEGPLGSTKYHQSLRWLQVFKSGRDLRDLRRASR